MARLKRAVHGKKHRRAVLKLAGGRLRLVSRHAGTSREDLLAQTGFDPEGEEGATTPEPTPGEMKGLQKLDPAGIRYSLA